MCPTKSCPICGSSIHIRCKKCGCGAIFSYGSVKNVEEQKYKIAVKRLLGAGWKQEEINDSDIEREIMKISYWKTVSPEVFLTNG